MTSFIQLHDDVVIQLHDVALTSFMIHDVPMTTTSSYDTYYKLRFLWV